MPYTNFRRAGGAVLVILTAAAAVAAAGERGPGGERAFDYVLHTDLVPFVPQPQPAKGGCLTDPAFRTTLCRVADVAADGVGADMAEPVYSRFTPLSSNGQLLYLQRTVGNPDGLIYSAVDYALVKILPDRITIDGVPDQELNSMEGAEIRWDLSGSHPERFYYRADTRFLAYDVTTDTAHLLHDFAAEFPTAAEIRNNVEGDSSADSRFWAWVVYGPYNGSEFPALAVITYDAATDQILGTMTLAAYQALGGHYAELPVPNMVEISPSGRRVIYHLGRCWDDGTGGNRPLDVGTVFDGPHAWDLDFTDPVKVSVDETHSGWGWDTAGNELFVSQNNVNDWIEAVDVMTGQVLQLYYHGDLGWGNGWHFARMPRAARGWVLLSTYHDGGQTDWGDNQLFMLELKDHAAGPRVWRLGHTHNVYAEGDYYAEAFAPIAQTADRLWWGAKWPGQQTYEAYEMALPPAWWADLGAPLFADGFEWGDTAAWSLALP